MQYKKLLKAIENLVQQENIWSIIEKNIKIFNIFNLKLIKELSFIVVMENNAHRKNTIRVLVLNQFSHAIMISVTA